MTSDKICTVEDCANKVLARGLCTGHYQQVRKFGTTSPLNGRGRKIPVVQEIVPPPMVTMTPCVELDLIPYEVRTWIQSWNKDGQDYVWIDLESFCSDEDLATDRTKAWANRFKESYPKEDIILVHCNG